MTKLILTPVDTIPFTVSTIGDCEIFFLRLLSSQEKLKKIEEKY